jgi:hypothetical protein
MPISDARAQGNLQLLPLTERGKLTDSPWTPNAALVRMFPDCFPSAKKLERVAAKRTQTFETLTPATVSEYIELRHEEAEAIEAVAADFAAAREEIKSRLRLQAAEGKAKVKVLEACELANEGRDEEAQALAALAVVKDTNPKQNASSELRTKRHRRGGEQSTERLLGLEVEPTVYFRPVELAKLRKGEVGIDVEGREWAAPMLSDYAVKVQYEAPTSGRGVGAFRV